MTEKSIGGHHVRFMSQECQLTLKEGLDELYTGAPEVAAVSARKGKEFRDHDLTHVIFGCDTSLNGEILLNPWVLFGTTITRSELKDYAADPDVMRLNAEGIDLMGGRLRGYSLFVVYYLPLYVWIWARHVRCMAMKWPHSSVTEEMLNTPLSELRRQFGIWLYCS